MFNTGNSPGILSEELGHALIPFALIAGDTGESEIAKAVASTSTARTDMVNRERNILSPTVSAAPSIFLEQIRSSLKSEQVTLTVGAIVLFLS
ncbi:hypothetical protein BAE29_12095 [Acidithiobacillus caldus]|uniref:Uncharacterized protein n=1 Tax=Acidithiobacillus caldus TaxID=33059 RepID=A0A1E7YPN9_9PROT|nr:hypothetical protein BAE28_10705 [Acidithiobacillus caldus]OFC37030.1 hypothetical protein BAE29_12095 [Acidithiobacillus caldus]OFC37284.1 hypothetical protein BAE27_04285 [Acidithiobacillus caldus]